MGSCRKNWIVPTNVGGAKGASDVHNRTLLAVFPPKLAIVVNNLGSSGPCNVTSTAAAVPATIQLTAKDIGCFESDKQQCLFNRCRLVCSNNKNCIGIQMNPTDCVLFVSSSSTSTDFNVAFEEDTSGPSFCLARNPLGIAIGNSTSSVPFDGQELHETCSRSVLLHPKCGVLFFSAPGSACLCLSQNSSIPFGFPVDEYGTVGTEEWGSLFNKAWGKVLGFDSLPRHWLSPLRLGIHIEDSSIGGGSLSCASEETMPPTNITEPTFPKAQSQTFEQTPEGIATIVLALLGLGIVVLYYLQPRRKVWVSSRSTSAASMSTKVVRSIKQQVSKAKSESSVTRPGLTNIDPSSGSIAERLPPNWTTVYNPKTPGQPLYRNKVTGELTSVQPDLLSLRQFMQHPHSLPPPAPPGTNPGDANSHDFDDESDGLSFSSEYGRNSSSVCDSSIATGIHRLELNGEVESSEEAGESDGEFQKSLFVGRSYVTL